VEALLKFITSILSGVIIGAFGVYFTLDLKEEKLGFSLDESAQFGDITYQSLRIRNTGWDPATNVLLIVNHPDITNKNVKATTSLRPSIGEEGAIGIIERIRRNEEVIVSFSFKGAPITTRNISTKSDRSVAKLIEKSDRPFNWATFFIGAAVGFFSFIFLGVFIKTYQDYQKRAKEVAARKTLEALQSNSTLNPLGQKPRPG